MINGDSNDVCTVSTVQYEYFVRLFVCLHKSDMIVGRRERGRRCGEKPPPATIRESGRYGMGMNGEGQYSK